MTLFDHEEAWRGAAAITRLRDLQIAVCGAGLLGSLIADNLARQGAASFILVDGDRIEEHNTNQLYRLSDVGRYKVDAMADHLYDLGSPAVIPHRTRLEARNIQRFLQRAWLVLDCFDNRASRLLVAEYCAAAGIPCLHLGLSGDGFGQVAWNDTWPRPQADPDGPAACAVPLARNLALLVVAVATEMIWDWLEGGPVNGCAGITLRDLTISLQ